MNVKELRVACDHFAECYFSALMKKRIEDSKFKLKCIYNSKLRYISDSQLGNIFENDDDLQVINYTIMADAVYMFRTNKNFIVTLTHHLYFWQSTTNQNEIISDLASKNDSYIIIPAALSAEEIKTRTIRYISDTAFMQYIENNILDDEDEDGLYLNYDDSEEDNLDKQVEEVYNRLYNTK